MWSDPLYGTEDLIVLGILIWAALAGLASFLED
jgi:hypothetical protein